MDTRDGKSYWVAKLKDGHCWMTQNLALDLSTDHAFTATDTNVTSPYVPSANTSTTPPTSGLSTSSIDTQLSWDFGKLVLAVPAYGTSCGNKVADVQKDCGKVSVVDVSDGAKFKPSYSAKEHQTWILPDSTVVEDTLVAIDCTEWTDDETLGRICTAGTYDSHYLIGNYYARKAAVAANTASSPTTSICPNGWRLPAQYINSFADGTFANMLREYGFVTNAAQNASAGNTTRATVDGQEYYLFGFPTHYVEAGYIHYQQYLSNLGSSLTLTFYTGGGGIFVANSTTITPSFFVNYQDGRIGNQIRCISL